MTTQKDEIIKKVSFPVRELTDIQAFEGRDHVTGDEISIPIPNRKAIYREDTGDILALPSTKYNLIPHKQVVESVFNEFDKSGIDYSPVRCELPGNGVHLYLHLRTPETYTIGDKGDEVQMETIIRNSYDGTSPFSMEIGGNRLVCTNGMRAYRKDFGISKKHYTFNTEDIVKKFMDQVRKFKEIFLPFLQKCAQTELTPSEGIQLIEALAVANRYKKAAAEKYVEEYKTLGYNHWALYNALTYVATHMTKTYMTRRDMEIKTFQEISQRVGN